MENARSPVLVALLHEMLNAEDFESLADVVDALKTNATALRIPYDLDAIVTALAIVGQTRQLVHRRGVV